MTHGLSPASRKSGLHGEAQLGIALDALSAYTDFNHYSRFIPGPDFVDEAGTATSNTTINRTSVKVFKDGFDSVVSYSFQKPRYWINGKVSARIWWTGENPAGTNGTMALLLAKTAIGDVLSSGSGSNVSVDLGVFTDYTLNVISSFDPIVTIFVGPQDDLISVTFVAGRSDVGDTYTTDFYLIGVEVYYKELNSQASYKISDDYKSSSRISSSP